MFILERKILFFSVSGLLSVISAIFIIIWGLPLGIDFTGGSLIEIKYIEERPLISEITNIVQELSFEYTTIQPTNELGVIIRSKSLSEKEHAQMLEKLTIDGTFEITEERFTTIGPSLGEELKNKALIAIILSISIIIIFVAFVFRHVSKPVASWKYGIVAIIALFHDILIPTGLFVLLSRFTDVQADALFVSALLAILGLSVNDTIVVFDRIRENLTKRVSKNFNETVGISLSETITRSINTSLTTLLVLGTLYFIGPESTKSFALVLSVGLIAGTYSSIFLASPLLVEIEKRQRNK